MEDMLVGFHGRLPPRQVTPPLRINWLDIAKAVRNAGRRGRTFRLIPDRRRQAPPRGTPEAFWLRVGEYRVLFHIGGGARCIFPSPPPFRSVSIAWRASAILGRRRDSARGRFFPYSNHLDLLRDWSHFSSLPVGAETGFAVLVRDLGFGSASFAAQNIRCPDMLRACTEARGLMPTDSERKGCRKNFDIAQRPLMYETGVSE